MTQSRKHWSTRRRLERACDKPIHCLATHEPKEITVAVLAAYKETSERTIVRMIGQQLSAHRVGREWRISTESARVAFGETVSRGTPTNTK